MIVVIPCVMTKRNKPNKPKNLYISTYFNFCSGYAESVTSLNKIFILSAKYGFLKYNDEQIIEPYEISFNNKTGYIPQKLLNIQAKHYNIKTAFVLGGVNYINRAKIAIKNVFCLQDVFKENNLGIAGIGKQNQFLKNNVGVKFW